MSILNIGDQEPTERSDYQAGSPRKIERNLKGFVDYMLVRYGGSPKFMIDMAQSAAKFARKLRVGNKRFRMALDVVEYGVPAAVLTSDLFSKLMDFDKVTREKPNIYSDREQKIRMLLGLKESDHSFSIIGGPFVVGKDVCTWIASRPKTTKFVIEGFYKYDDLKASQSMLDVDRGDVFVVINFEERRFVWQVSYLRYEEKLTINDSVIYFMANHVDKGRDAKRSPCGSAPDNYMAGTMDRLKKAVFGDFLEHFDVHNNVIHLNRGLSSRPRIVFHEKVNQYNIEAFVAEVRKVLKRGRKRGYAFVGVPGTGKSTIIRKLENIIRDYPMVYLGAENMNYQHDIIEAFRTISYMQPCIVVLEDLDSFEFEEKTERLGAFLDCIDDVNRNLNAVFVATINDTKLVHYTLINRPGRLDEVILVEPPKTPLEAYEVMQARFGKIVQTDSAVSCEFPELKDIDEGLFKAIIDNHMTQADICELVEKAILLSDAVTNESLQKAVDALLSSKLAIKLCDFGGKNPYDSDSPDCDRTMAPVSKNLEIDAQELRAMVTYAERASIEE